MLFPVMHFRIRIINFNISYSSIVRHSNLLEY